MSRTEIHLDPAVPKKFAEASFKRFTKAHKHQVVGQTDRSGPRNQKWWCFCSPE